MKRPSLQKKLEALNYNADEYPNVCDMRMKLFQHYGVDKASMDKKKEEASTKVIEDETEVEPTPAKKVKLEKTGSTYNPNAKCYIDKVSNDTLLHIFGYLDGSTMGNAVQVCKPWKKLISDAEPLWKNLFDRRWKNEAIPFVMEKIKEDLNSGSSWKKIYSDFHKKYNIIERGAITDLDKAGDTVFYLVEKVLGLALPSDSLGEVYYGPVGYVSAKKAAKIYDVLKETSLEKFLSFYTPEEKGFPEVLGGMECTKARKKDDIDYLTWHFAGYRLFLKNIVARGNGYAWFYY